MPGARNAVGPLSSGEAAGISARHRTQTRTPDPVEPYHVYPHEGCGAEGMFDPALSDSTRTSSGRDVQLIRDHAQQLRDHEARPPLRKRPTSAALRPHEHIQRLQQMVAANKHIAGSASSARPSHTSGLQPPARAPPLEAALEDAGLGHYRRKLVDDMSCSTVEQLVALDPEALDALITALRPLPGHRVRLTDFVERQRELRAHASSPASAPHRKLWKASLAQLQLTAANRSKRPGEMSQLQQPGHWGRGQGSKGEAPVRGTHVSSVRVLTRGRSRVVVYDGPSPNSPTGLGMGASTNPSELDAWGATWTPLLGTSLGSTALGSTVRSGASSGAAHSGRRGGAHGTRSQPPLTAPSGPTTNSAGFGDNLAGALHVDWAALSAKLPSGKDEASTARRGEMWRRYDPNGNGFLSSAEVDLMVRDAVGEEMFSAKPVIQQAFHAARRSGGSSQHGRAGDYVERSEFRTLLVCLRQYYELYAMFNRLDVSDDRRIELAEFRKGVAHIEQWGVVLPANCIEEEFRSIDTNGGGHILFDEFSKWAISKALDLEEDDDFDGSAVEGLEAVGYVAARGS